MFFRVFATYFDLDYRCKYPNLDFREQLHLSPVETTILCFFEESQHYSRIDDFHFRKFANYGCITNNDKVMRVNIIFVFLLVRKVTTKTRHEYVLKSKTKYTKTIIELLSYTVYRPRYVFLSSFLLLPPNIACISKSLWISRVNEHGLPCWKVSFFTLKYAGKLKIPMKKVPNYVLLSL